MTATAPAFEVTNLHKRYRSTVAVDDVSFTVAQGEIFGVLGRNGAGKTTTVESIAGLRRPDRGTATVLGLDPRRDRAQVRAVLGVQLQDAHMHGSLTVEEVVTLHRSFHRSGADPDQLIAMVELDEQRRTRAEKLSGGQLQRLAIALALVGRPRAVILDELTSGLDPEARRRVWRVVESLRDDGVTVLLVSHLMEEVERLCDRVALLDRGRVAATDTPSGLVARAGLGQRVRFRVHEGSASDALASLPGVTDVEVRGEQVAVTGGGDLLQEVSTALVRAGVVVSETRLERATLEDAFLALTGQHFDAGAEGIQTTDRHRAAEVTP